MLRRGDKGPEVEALQKSLLALQFLKDIMDVDGDYGPKTESAVKKFQRAAGTFVDGVAGPQTMERLRHAVPAEMPDFSASTFLDGWYHAAIRCPAWPGRVGGTIDPYITVVHTTDTYPGGMAAILRSWATTTGKGNAANFLLGRGPNTAEAKDYPTGGLAQMIPITRNGNHAGGGGTFVVGGKPVHPNTVSVGIEIDCAGRLGKPRNGKFFYPGSLRTIPDEDVFVDAKGVGWHKVTEYQYGILDTLLRDLQASYRTPPGVISILPKGTYKDNGVPWGEMTGQIVGHVSLNPTDKTDPGPQTVAWLSAR